MISKSSESRMVDGVCSIHEQIESIRKQITMVQQLAYLDFGSLSNSQHGRSGIVDQMQTQR